MSASTARTARRARLVEPDDVEGWTETLRELLLHDPARRALADRGRDRVQGPKELAYERSTRVTTWVIAGLWAFAAMTWIVWATQDPYEPGLVALMWLAALAFLLGVANAFDTPARQTLVVDLVGREDMPQHFLLELKNFFEQYKVLENKKVEIDTFQDQGIAFRIIKESIDLYNETYKK